MTMRTRKKKRTTVTTEPSGGVRGRRMFAVCTSLLFLVPIAAIVLHAEPPLLVQSTSQASKNDYALIYGTVFGPTQRLVAGVPITIRRASGTKAKWNVVSDNRGEFAQRVPVGRQDYIVEAEIKMPKGQPKPAITVHIDDNERKDVSLHLTR